MSPGNCSIKHEELRSFADAFLPPEREEELVRHIFSCSACCAELRAMYSGILQEQADEFTFSVSEQEEARELIRRLVRRTADEQAFRARIWGELEKYSKRCGRALAAADDQTADQKQARLALRSRTIIFSAVCGEDEPGYWKARILLPPAPQPQTKLLIEVEDAAGNPRSSGTLIFCGMELPVDKGMCAVPLIELREHLKKQTIVYCDGAGNETEGQLELFSSNLDEE